jgi:cell division protein FtsB
LVAGQVEDAVRKLPRLSPARVAFLAALVVVGYFVHAAVGDTILSQRINDDERRLQQQIAELRDDEVRLTAIRGYLRTDEYIEGAARRLLGLVRPGETLYIVSSSVTPTPSPDDGEDEVERLRWWEQLYGP